MKARRPPLRLLLVLPLGLLAVAGTGSAGEPEGPATAAQPPGPIRFRDVTAHSGVGFVHTFGDAEMSNLVESNGVGVCLLDFDGDRLPDLYFVNGARLPEISDPPADPSAPPPENRLYHNLGGMRFEDVTERAGVGDTGYGMGCAVGDLDNDGDPDLLVTNYGANRVYRNDGVDAAGDVHFTDVTSETGLGDPAWSLGAVLVDVDGDGRLDVYVGNYVRFDPKYRAFYIADRFPGPLSYPGSADHLYRNLGGWRFEDVTRRAGVGNPEGRAMGVGAADLDGDGDIDILVANDAMANYFYRNRGDGRFDEVALEVGLGLSENGEATAAMGVDFGDVDGDGRLDVVVPDMTYSTLYQALPGGLFEDRSRRSGLATAAAQYVGWSGHFADFDRDGRLDLLLTTGDLHDMEPMEDVLLWNQGGGRFRDVSAEAGDHFRQPTLGRGAAVGDLDDDGDLDVVLTVLGGPAIVLENVSPSPGHWLSVRTVGRASNRDGIGARVSVETAGGVQVREVRTAAGYLSASDPRVFFGLGGATVVDRLTVRWPSGRVETRRGVAVDQFLTVEEPR